MSKNAKRTAKASVASVAKLTNVPAYTFDQAIHDALTSKSTEGKAEAGMVVALFSDEQWTLEALQRYFGAAKSQSVIVNGVRKIDKNIPTRAKIAQAYLSTRSAEYKTALDALEAAKAELNEADKAKPKNVLLVTQLDFKVDSLKKPLDAAYQMFHRALTSIYQAKANGYIAVRLGRSNELLVTNATGVEEMFSATSVRKAGNDALVAAKLVQPRGKRKSAPVTAVSAIDAQNAKPVIASLGNMLEAETFNPPIETDSENVIDQNDIAELALRCVMKLSKTDNAEIKGTVSQIIVTLMPLINAKSFDAVQKIAKQAVNA
jgi:hypothetical protein